MKTKMLDKVFTEPAPKRIRGVEERRVDWESKLQAGLQDEQQGIRLLKLSQERMITFDDVMDAEDWEYTLKHHASTIDFMFSNMNYVVCFDWLLGGTGISKDVNQTAQMSTDQ